jgi:hypothetical protein
VIVSFDCGDVAVIRFKPEPTADQEICRVNQDAGDGSIDVNGHIGTGNFLPTEHTE